MRKSSLCLLALILILAFSNTSWAQFPCNPGDLVDVCCGADEGTGGYSYDLGTCDTIYIEPWPHTDTCFIVSYPVPDTICINDPGEPFPCFVHVGLFVTHDSNTFWNTGPEPERWEQDSITAFVAPLLFWHVPEGCVDSVIFPFVDMSWNNPAINPFYPWMDRSMFRHFVDSRTGDTTYNRMLQMVEDFKKEWNVYTDMESHSSDGDSGHVFLNAVIMDAACQRWWEGSKTLLATFTFQIYAPPECDSALVCFDSTFWSPASRLTFTRRDAVNYFPRHNLPFGIKVKSDGSVDTCTCSVPTDVRWIEGSTEEESRPASFSVSQNYPNPFNPVTNFKFTLPQASSVKIEIFNILGQRVKTLLDEDMRAGKFVVDWDGKDERGTEVSSGIYFYRIRAGDFSDIKRMVLLK